MNSMTLIWAALKRRKARTIFTWSSVGVEVVFGVLAALVPMQRITRLLVADALRRA